MMFFRRSSVLRPAAAVAAAVVATSLLNKRALADNQTTDSQNTAPDSHLMLDHRADSYRGVIIDHTALPSAPEKFSKLMANSLLQWRSESKRGVWLSIPPSHLHLSSLAVTEHGFEIHSADPSGLILTKWLAAECENHLPAGATHSCGVGSLIVDSSSKRILVVKERNGPTAGKNFYKLPTGTVEPGESLEAACARELKEETGLEGKVGSLIMMRHLPRYLNGKGDLFFVFLVQVDESQPIEIQESELEDAKWMPLDDYFNQDIGSLFPQNPTFKTSYGIYNGVIAAAIKDGPSRSWRPSLPYHLYHAYHSSAKVSSEE